MKKAVPGLTSVVIVAADSGAILRSSVSAALASIDDVEVVLVDNASVDGEPECVESEHAGEPRLRIVRNARNLGFGPACNLGAALARGDLLLFLNPDCLIDTDTIAGLRSVVCGERGDVGLAGVTVCTPDGTAARGNRRREPTLRRAVLSALGLARFAPRWPALAGIEMPATPAAAVEDVDAVSGACMCVPRSAFERVGGFDEGYFLHAEDLDLCRRIRDAGLRVVIANTLRVVHEQGSSSRHRAQFVAFHKHRGMWRYFVKFDPAARNIALRGLVWAGIWLHYAFVSTPSNWLRRLRV